MSETFTADGPISMPATACEVGDTRAEPYTDVSPADRYRDTLKRIAEIDGPIECTSLRDWQRKVKAMAANAVKGIK